MYEEELAALERSGRLRKRVIYPQNLIDLASNDYLRLAHNKSIFNRAIKRIEKYGVFGAKASQLVSGYTKIHRDFERFMAKRGGFEAAIVIGSGFLGNIALFETLPRKGDLLLIDADYHASGVLAAKTSRAKVEFFAHNSAENLREKLRSAQAAQAKRIFVAIEGVYSMSGQIADRAIFETAREFGAVLILDEAHSGGLIGKKLCGALDFYGFSSENVVRLGTLGKTYGSYGAYILADRSIASFLINRAKPIIYSTAPSLFDIAYAHEAALHIHINSSRFCNRITEAIAIAAKQGFQTKSLILPIPFESNSAVMSAQKRLMKEGFLVGAIRPPTTHKPQLRVILRETPARLRAFFKLLQNL